MKLYHGTDECFSLPLLEKCEPGKDFGKGFYLTNKLEMAKDWGRKKNVARSDFFVLKYEIDDDFLANAELSVGSFSADDKWAKFVYDNREKRNFSHPYDIVIGPVADNVLSAHFGKIKRREKTFSEIAKELHYNKFKALQYAFITEKGLKFLKYAGYDKYTDSLNHRH